LGIRTRQDVVQAKVALRLAKELPEAERAALVRDLAKTLCGVLPQKNSSVLGAARLDGHA
jgi:hypothetical protein